MGRGESKAGGLVASVEAKNRFADTEIGTIIKDGKVILTVGGNKQYAEVKEADVPKLEGAVFTHNHVTGSARLSVEDIQETVNTKLGEIRATDRQGNTSSLKLTNKALSQKNTQAFSNAYDYKGLEEAKAKANDAARAWRKKQPKEKLRNYWSDKSMRAEEQKVYKKAFEDAANEWLTKNAPKYGYKYSYTKRKY